MKNSPSKIKRKRKFKYFLFFIAFFLIINIYCKNKKEFSFIEHKNIELDLYLDLIRYNCQEKIGILPYILKNRKGIYLEIGTGGDAIATMLDQIPSTADVLVIASDIDSNILNSLTLRHPSLQKYIDLENGPRLKLQELNAINMSIFEDNFFDGINSSSILHEIFSYELGFKGIEKFFKEAFRTLKLGGILVYRDPEGVENKNSIVYVKLKNKLIRLFFHIFIYKFLDTKGSSLSKSGRKIQLYNSDDIVFNIYKKNESNSINLTYSQYLKIPSFDIDFSRNYKIILPFGLYRELARHYITYLHQCNPLTFVNFTPDIYSGFYKVNYLAHSTAEKFNNFLEKYNWQIVDGKINIKQKNNFEKHIYKNTKVLEFGIPLHFTSKAKENQLRNLLNKHGFSPGNHIIALSNGDCLLDYRIFGIFYNELNKNIFDSFNVVVNKNDIVHAKWLKREGEEFYFNYSADELITKVLKITMVEDKNEKGEKEIFVLCPLSKKHNKFIQRICYTEILNSSLSVKNSLKYPVEVKDGKRIIHFCKMPLKKALDIYKEIIDANPFKYKNLQKMVICIESKYK